MNAEKHMAESLKGQFWTWNEWGAVENIGHQPAPPEVAAVEAAKPRDWVCVASNPVRPDRGDLLRTVAAISNFSVGQIKSPSRERNLCCARQAYFYLAHRHTKSSFPAIGKIMDRDHSTVFHGIQRVMANPEKYIEIIGKVEVFFKLPASKFENKETSNGVPFS